MIPREPRHVFFDRSNRHCRYVLRGLQWQREQTVFKRHPVAMKHNREWEKRFAELKSLQEYNQSSRRLQEQTELLPVRKLKHLGSFPGIVRGGTIYPRPKQH